MDLILWRHADAGDAIEDELRLDVARELSSKGEKQAQRMAEWLNRFLPDSTRVLVSPALRCQQTAQALGRKFQTREALGPGGTVGTLLTLARWPERREPVLVIGHQPTLGLVAATLMGGAQTQSARPGPHDAPAWSVRKGAVWWLRHRERGGVAEVVLVSVRSPETL
ncbi:MAG: histidine phosphatase family protein [Rubrivivax sp.]